MEDGLSVELTGLEVLALLVGVVPAQLKHLCRSVWGEREKASSHKRTKDRCMGSEREREGSEREREREKKLATHSASSSGWLVSHSMGSAATAISP